MASPRRLSTSLSDNQAYPQVCLEASRDFRRFNRFRRHPVYNEVLEHVSREQGAEYLAAISRDTAILGAMDAFRLNDEYGNPRTYEYSGAGRISPSTLRYVKVLADLKAHFHSLDHLRICEIGVGYGGQCRIINALYRPAAYCLVDIQPALALAQRYLDHFIVPAGLVYRTMNELGRDTYDLAISNYAFTELPRAIQDVYLDKVLLRAKRGYITYNEITPPEFRSYRADELLGLIPGSRRLPEEPLSHPRNCILVWGDRASRED
jgi:putative sugar O-methyltransferase